MARQLHRSHLGLHLRSKLPNAITLPETLSLDTLIEMPMSGLSSILKRSSSDSSVDCDTQSSNPACQKPTTANNVTLPVALGVAIPVAVAIVLFVYLHRRHVKNLRKEDANDPHKSLDFGWDPTSKHTKKTRRGKPEMVLSDNGVEKRPRGLSMDMEISSPYVLPHGLGGSRESLHSMSRTIHTHDDRYRPATTYVPNDGSSAHSYKTDRRGADDSSSYTGSASITRSHGDDMKKDLLGNAQRMSRSMPPVNRSPVPQIQLPQAAKEAPREAIPSNPNGARLSPKFPLLDSRDPYMSKDGADLRKSNNYLGAFIHSRDPSADLLGQKSDIATPKSEYATPNEFPSTPSSTLQQPGPSSTLQRTSSRKSPPPAIDTAALVSSSPPHNIAKVSTSMPLRKQSLPSSEQGQIVNFQEDATDYDDGAKVAPSTLHSSQPSQNEVDRGSSQAYMPPIDEYSLGVKDSNKHGYDVHRMSMGFRPLPPDDPTDNPEQRANRIRSFYKEYFDDSKPGPIPAPAQYYEDYDQEYLVDGALFDPTSGRFVASQSQYVEPRGRPYAEPYGRRAMTPPPRAPPRFARKHASTLSGNGRPIPPGSRALSSSGRVGSSGRGLPKKLTPPPQPLRVLPSPHLLKEDSFALPIDFAPPTSARERQAGRPESPRGGLRPYSPIVPAHMPLMSSFDDLAAMPSP